MTVSRGHKANRCRAMGFATGLASPFSRPSARTDHEKSTYSPLGDGTFTGPCGRSDARSLGRPEEDQQGQVFGDVVEEVDLVGGNEQRGAGRDSHGPAGRFDDLHPADVITGRRLVPWWRGRSGSAGRHRPP